MIIIFDEYIQFYYVFPITSFLMFTMMFAINHWNVTPLERNLMNNFKKFQVLISRILIETIIISIILGILSILLGDVEVAEIKEVASLLAFAISLVLVSFCLSLIFNFTLYLCIRIFLVRHDYYINLADSDKKWFLIRKSNKKQILLTDQQGEYLFLNEWNEIVFKMELAPLNKFHKFLYMNKKRFNIILSVLLLLMVTAYVIPLYFDFSKGVDVIFFLVTIISWITFALLMKIRKVIVE